MFSSRATSVFKQLDTIIALDELKWAHVQSQYMSHQPNRSNTGGEFMVKELKGCCCSYSKALGVYIYMCFEACSIICILQSLQISRKCLLGTTIKVRTHFVKLLCKPPSVSGNSMVRFCQGCNFINTIFVLSTHCKMVGLFFTPFFNRFGFHCWLKKSIHQLLTIRGCPEMTSLF